MRTETLILRPFNLTSSRRTLFSFAYFDSYTKKQISLLTDGVLYQGPLAARDMRPLDEKKIFFDSDVFECKIDFDSSMMDKLMQKDYSFEEMKKLNANEREALIILRHPDVYNATGEQSHNHKAGDKRWVVELAHKKVSDDYKSVIIRMLAMNRFFKEDPIQWREIAFVFGVNPAGKNADELATLLASPDRGILLSSKEKAQEFIEFVKDFDTSSPRVVVQKALALGVIYKERESYSYYETSLGRTVDDVVGFVSRDKTINMQLIKSIEEYDVDLVRYAATCEEAKDLLEQSLNDVKSSGDKSPSKSTAKRPVKEPATAE